MTVEIWKSDENDEDGDEDDEDGDEDDEDGDEDDEDEDDDEDDEDGDENNGEDNGKFIIKTVNKYLRRINISSTTYNADKIVYLKRYDAKYGPFIEYDNDYNEDNMGNIINRNIQFWFNSGNHRNIFSIKELYQMFDYTLHVVTNKILNLEEWENDTKFWPRIKKMKGMRPICVMLEDNIPKLYVMGEMMYCLLFLTTSSNKKLIERKFSLYIQRNLFKYFKGLPFEICSDYEGEFCKLVLTNIPQERFTVEYKSVKYDYWVYTGEKINIMDVADYIGLAITTPDFPVKEQNYPHFDFDFEKDFSTKNRRHYIPKTEENIIGFVTPPMHVGETVFTFKKEKINDQINAYTGNKILFLKYFGKDDDLNCINYENNDGNTTLKMDLMNVMPLKKFTLRLFLIDRYNNLEPLHPQIEGFDDVIKLQLLFTRIKGVEKENRNFIETILKEPERVELEIVEEENEEEEEEEMLPDENNFVFIPYNPNEKEENELAPPAEKKIFINENDDEDVLPVNEEEEFEEENELAPPAEKKIFINENDKEEEIEEEEEEDELAQNNYLNNPEEEENNPENELY